MGRSRMLVLGIVALMAVGGIGVIASYTVGQITGTVTVAEPITYTPSSFTSSLLPGGVDTKTVTVSNSGTTDVMVSPSAIVSPPTGLTAALSASSVSVPAGGSNTFTVTLTAVNPGSYTVTVALAR